jgi:multidrug efflux pump subunit AcrA (membrane-fusion protein)
MRLTLANSFSVAGQFIPYQNVELHAKVAGYIKNIYVDIGDPRTSGEVLAVLEIPERTVLSSAKLGHLLRPNSHWPHRIGKMISSF